VRSGPTRASSGRRPGAEDGETAPRGDRAGPVERKPLAATVAPVAVHRRPSVSSHRSWAIPRSGRSAAGRSRDRCGCRRPVGWRQTSITGTAPAADSSEASSSGRARAVTDGSNDWPTFSWIGGKARRGRCSRGQFDDSWLRWRRAARPCGPVARSSIKLPWPEPGAARSGPARAPDPSRGSPT